MQSAWGTKLAERAVVQITGDDVGDGRVLVIGGPLFRDYARLRATLDAALTNRLPDVVILTPGGSGSGSARPLCDDECLP